MIAKFCHHLCFVDLLDLYIDFLDNLSDLFEDMPLIHVYNNLTRNRVRVQFVLSFEIISDLSDKST